MTFYKEPLYKEPLAELIKAHALKIGEFTLSSGLKSGYFLDMSKVTGRSDGLYLICDYIIERLAWDGEIVHSVSGPVLGAAPIVSGLLSLYQRKSHGVSVPMPLLFAGNLLRGFYVRKEPKNGQYIEGPLEKGDRVLVVEDVITTGTQTLNACQRIEEAGGNVVQVIAVVDRLQGGGDKIREKYGYSSILTVHDLGIKPDSQDKP